MSVIENYAVQIKEIADRLIAAANAGEIQRREDLEEELSEGVFALLEVEKPKIMVAGIYSAGKSTLINALCRKYVAKVAASPETSEIKEYPYGDFCLIDSPGVDAPIRHEDITDSHVSQCHILMFVISTGMFESVANYRKMYEWIQSGVPFLIVVNDKTGAKALNDDPEIEEIKKKVIRNLREISGSNSIADSYDIIAVNAKRACDVFLEGKSEALLKYSNLDALENKIYALSQKGNAMKIFANPITNLMNILDDYEKNLLTELADTEGEEFEKKMTLLYKKRDDMEEDFKLQLRLLISSKESMITNAVMVGKNVDQMKEELFCEIRELCQVQMEKMMLFMKKTFPDIDVSMNIGDILSGMNPGKIAGDFSGLDLRKAKEYADTLYRGKQDDSEKMKDNRSDFLEKISDSMSDIISIKTNGMSDMPIKSNIMRENPLPGKPTDKMVLNILLMGAEYLFNKAFDEKKDDAKRAEMLAKQADEENRQEKERLNNELRARQEARMYSQDICMKITRTVTNVFSDSIEKNVQGIANRYVAMQNEQEGKRQEIEKEITLIQDMKSQLTRIKAEIM